MGGLGPCWRGRSSRLGPFPGVSRLSWYPRCRYLRSSIKKVPRGPTPCGFVPVLSVCSTTESVRLGKPHRGFGAYDVRDCSARFHTQALRTSMCGFQSYETAAGHARFQFPARASKLLCTTDPLGNPAKSAPSCLSAERTPTLGYAFIPPTSVVHSRV